MAEPLSFERFEYKYYVPDHLTETIRHYIAPYLVSDHHCARSPDKSYLITNLYFDTPHLNFFRAHMDNAVDRFKLRIRTYGEDGGENAYLEVKRKIRQVVVKTRAGVPRHLCKAILDGDVEPDAAGVEWAHLVDFIDRMIFYGATPNYLIRYKREAYENVFDEDARVTFDREICFQRVHGFDLRGDPRAWTYVDGPQGLRGVRAANLLEIKFTSQVPRWMVEMIRRFNLQRDQFSKYLTVVNYSLTGWCALPDDQRSSVLRA